MKEFQLSTRNERIASLCFSVIMIACMGVLVYALRNDTMLLVLCGLCVLLVSVLIVVSVIGMLTSKLILNTETKTLEVKGLRNYTVDVSKAILLQTISRKSGHIVNRALVFSDAEENVIAIIPTNFTSKHGVLAEPMAKEMAQVMGIDFKENVPAWEYDKEKYEEHLKEEAEEAKKARKERAEMRKKKLLYRYRKK